VALYRITPGTSRTKAIVALSSLSVTIPTQVYFHAVENPNGFNRLMYSWMKYKETGQWPAQIPPEVSVESLNPIITNTVT